MDKGLALGIGAVITLFFILTGPWWVLGVCKILHWRAKRELRKSEERLAKLRELQNND